MKAKNIVGKKYVSPMPIKGILKHFIEAFKLQFIFLIGGGILTWGRRVPASALPTWGSMPQVGNT